MATIKEIAEIVGVSSAAVSRVLNYDEGISVSDETREAIFATAEKIGYKKRVIYPKIENVALLYFTDNEDELEDVFYHGVREEIVKQAKKMNIQISIYDRKDGMDAIPKDLTAFIAVGWLTRKEINKLYKICKKGVFIGTSPDEKLFDAVKPNMDSFVTQIWGGYACRLRYAAEIFNKEESDGIIFHVPFYSYQCIYGAILCYD